jgi:hypothetical protein
MPRVSHLARHLLAFEHPAWVLSVARAANRAVTDAIAVTRTLALEIVALHRASKPVADGGATHVNVLPSLEMAGEQRRSNGEQRVPRDSELDAAALDGHAGVQEVASQWSCDLLHLLASSAHLQGVKPLLFNRLDLDDLNTSAKAGG